MENDCRKSDLKTRQSRRRTLLCYSTLCLFSFLIVFFFLIEIFSKRSISFERNSNQSLTLNLLKFHSSLIECGQSVVVNEYLYRNLELVFELIKNLNKTNISVNQQFNENILKENFVQWLDLILNKCFKARQFSIIEQEKPTFFRQIISFLRKEFLYLTSFFIKDL